MSELKTLDDLKDLAKYKVDLAKSLTKLKMAPVAARLVKRFPFNGKTAPMLLLGPVPATLAPQLKAFEPKLGKCVKRPDGKVVVATINAIVAQEALKTAALLAKHPVDVNADFASLTVEPDEPEDDPPPAPAMKRAPVKPAVAPTARKPPVTDAEVVGTQYDVAKLQATPSARDDVVKKGTAAIDPSNTRRQKLADSIKYEIGYFNASMAEYKASDAKLKQFEDALKDAKQRLAADATDAKAKADADVAGDGLAELKGWRAVTMRVNKARKDRLDRIAKTTDAEERYRIFFEDKAYQKIIDDAQKQAATAYEGTQRKLMILGRTTDTHAIQADSDGEKARLLNVADPQKYTLAANDAFMKGALDMKAEFAMVTAFSRELIAFLKQPNLDSTKLVAFVRTRKSKEPAMWSGDDASGQPAVSCRELGQILDDGYWYGEYSPDGGPVRQMLFPKSLPRNFEAKFKAELAEKVAAMQKARASAGKTT